METIREKYGISKQSIAKGKYVISEWRNSLYIWKL
jgi:hypothetical protein